MPEYISPYKAESTSQGRSQENGNGDGNAATASSSSHTKAISGKTVLIDNYDSFTYNVVEVRVLPSCLAFLPNHEFV
jgi:hypothetical protein